MRSPIVILILILLNPQGTRSVAGLETRRRDHMVPWWLFAHYKSATMSLQDMQAEFVQAVEGPGSTAEWLGGEWCVALHMGSIRDRVSGEMNYSDSHADVSVTSAQQFEELRAAGARMLQEYSAQVQPLRALGSTNAPRADSTVADQPCVPAPTDFVGSAIVREVAEDVLNICFF